MIRRMVDTLAGVLLRASRRPGVQKAGEALLYYDSVTRRLRLATEDGDAAVGGTGGGGGAPTSSQYVTLATDATLTAERVLTGTAGRLTVTDNGAGSTVVLDVGADVYRAGGTDVAIADGGTGASTPAGARAALGVVIGTDVQAYDAQLAALAATTPTAGSLHTWDSATSASVLAAGAEGTSLTIVNGVPAWVALGVASAIQLAGGTDTPIPADASFVDAADGNAEAFLSFQVP